MNNVFDHILSLKRGVTSYGPAPHKPILLLALIESFEKGEIKDNWIELTDDLFQHFHDIWRLLVKTQHTPNFSLPFYHLKNEKGTFWKLITFPGKEIPTTKSKSIKSFKALNETVLAAQLSDEMFVAFSDPVIREELKIALLEKYFGIKELLLMKETSMYSNIVKTQILYDPDQNYTRNVKRQIEEQSIEAREEFMVLRSFVFRKAILEIYNNQCAVSGLKVADVKNRSLVDACHIMPFAESYNDSIRNGLALSPTFHRAFDRGIIAISDNYKVLVHPSLRDFNPEAGIRQYENQDLYLPKEGRFHPSINSLREHRTKFGFSN